jgi:hypothetical protein
MADNLNIPKPEDVKRVNEELGNLEDQLLSIANTLSDRIKSAIEDVRDGADTVAEIFAKRLDKSIKEIAKGSDTILTNTFKLATGSAKVSDIQKQISQNETKRAAIAANLKSLQERGIIDATTRAAKESELNEAINGQNALLEDQVAYGEKINKNLGLTGGLLKGINKIPILGEFINSEKALAAAQAEAAKEGGNRLKVLGAAGKQLGKDLSTNLTDPLVLFSAAAAGIVSTIKKIDELTTGTARNFGISKDQANDLNKELSGIARSSNDNFITTSKLNETFQALNSRYGTFADFSEENLVAFTELNKKAGISVETLDALQDITFLTGKGLKETTAEFEGQVKALKAQTGLAINEKQVLEGIKNISAATKLQLGGSAEAIATAVFKAKALGMELKDLSSISNSLLNFQSSIEDELSAELLTGKQLNLEGARYAALIGDQAMLAEEVAKSVGSAADFQKMNVLQQEALAKSLGLNRDSLAETLMQREALAKLGAKEGETQKEAYDRLVAQYGVEEARKRIGDENLANQLESTSIQEKFASITEKLQEAFIPLAEALLPIVDGFASLVSNATLLKVVVTAIAGVMAGSMARSLAINVASFGLMGKKAKETAIASIAGAAAEGGKSAAAIPMVGWITALSAIATIAALGYSFLKADDLFSPGGGYGKRMLVAPEGTFALNDRDNIIATTNPLPVNDMISRPKGSINVAPSAAASSRQEIKVAPANTEISLNLNGAALGNAVARQDYSVGNSIKSLGGKVDYSAPI